MITIQKLEEYFNNFNHTSALIQLGHGETIINSNIFVESHILRLKKNTGNRAFLPYYNRLTKFYKLCKKHQ